MSEEKEEDFVKVANTDEIMPSQMKEVELGGQKILVANIKGKYYAIGNICTHEGGPLADGTLHDYEVECPWHGSKFDVRTGEVTNPPADEPEPVYELKLDGNQLLIKKLAKVKSTSSTPSSSHFNIELTLLEKIKIDGTDAMSFKFSKQNEQSVQESSVQKSLLDYKAGQFAFFDIGGVYNDPKGPIRHFTISSSPTEDFIMLTTRIRDSPYKKRLESLKEGTQVKVKGPEGEFVLPDYDYSKTVVLISGGIGVTPFRSMIKYATDKKLPIKIIMFDSNRNEENILFKKEFDEWVNLNRNIKIVYTLDTSQDDWKGEQGHINQAMIVKYLDASKLDEAIFYICGPPGMLKAVQKLLQDDLHISKQRVRIEEFTGY